MEFLEALCRAIDLCEHLPILASIHEHWYLKDLNMDEWNLDMKVEAMVPSIINSFDDTIQYEILERTKVDSTANNLTVLDPEEEDRKAYNQLVKEQNRKNKHKD